MEILKLWNLLSIGIAGSFILVLLYLIYGSYKRKALPVITIPEFIILLPFKNEMAILPDRVSRLKTQLLANPKVKLWLLNDHSSDLGTHNRYQLELNEQIVLKNMPHDITGKKAVLSHAIKEASTDWVLIMDADTDLPDDLMLPDARILPNEAKCLLIPITSVKRQGWIPAFFDLDFLSLHFAGLASAKNNLPLLANGACMLICRKAYLSTIHQRKDWLEPSGDDVFAMFAIAKMYGRHSVKTLEQYDSPARVHFPNQLKELWNQRTRWISKTGQIKNTWFQFVSVIVLLTQIMLIANGFLSLKYSGIKMTIYITITVILAEIVYLAIASARLHRRDLWMFIVPAVFIYPFYLLSLLIFSTFAKSKWK